ncbi:MAG: hypothetical protein ACW96M_07055 [Candidatus Thorarchaeota archaeon]|jgi:hypothetical protein
MGRHWVSLAIALIVFSTALSPLVINTETYQAPSIDITIAYTHDLHSHLYSFPQRFKSFVLCGQSFSSTAVTS